MDFLVKCVEALGEHRAREEHHGLTAVLREAGPRALHPRTDDRLRGGLRDAGPVRRRRGALRQPHVTLTVRSRSSVGRWTGTLPLVAELRLPAMIRQAALMVLLSAGYACGPGSPSRHPASGELVSGELAPEQRSFEGVIEYVEILRTREQGHQPEPIRWSCSIAGDRILCSSSSGQSSVSNARTGLVCTPAFGPPKTKGPLAPLVDFLVGDVTFAATGRVRTIAGQPCDDMSGTGKGSGASVCASRALRSPTFAFTKCGRARCNSTDDRLLLEQTTVDSKNGLDWQSTITRIERRPIDPAIFAASGC